MLDAGDIEEVILVVVSEIALHLGRIHAAVGSGDVNRWGVQARKDIPSGPANRKPGGDQHANNCDENRHRARKASFTKFKRDLGSRRNFERDFWCSSHSCYEVAQFAAIDSYKGG